MEGLSDSTSLFLALTGASAIKYGVSMWISSRNRQNKYECVGRIREIYIFPVKSVGGLKVESAKCTTTGLVYNGVTDRHWAIATSDGVYITQRQLPRMALISTKLEEDMIVFNAPGMETLKLPKKPKIEKSSMSKIKIKLEWLESLDCGDKAADWFSTFLQTKGLRCHYSSPSMEKRDASNVEKLWKHDAKPGDILAFSDYCGYMLMTSSSLDDLNSRLEKPVTQLNFRPAIVVDGPKAFEEDEYDKVKINKATFRKIDACTRCILTTVDPFLGVKSSNEEPLKTLKTYRLKPCYGPKPLLGIHLALDTPDTINVGDTVYAVRTRK